MIEVKLVCCATENAAALVTLVHRLFHPRGYGSPEFLGVLPMGNVVGSNGKPHTKPEDLAGANLFVFVIYQIKETLVGPNSRTKFLIHPDKWFVQLVWSRGTCELGILRGFSRRQCPWLIHRFRVCPEFSSNVMPLVDEFCAIARH
jgi:hypothetical protein